MIKDSGSRRVFETGAVRDISEGKGRCDLLPLDTLSNIISSLVLHYLGEYQKTKNVDCIHRAIVEFSHEIDKSIPELMLEVSHQFEEGAMKYGIDNWKKGLPRSSYLDSAVRHYLKYRRGDTDERHDRAFLWNLICLMWTEENTDTMRAEGDTLDEKTNGETKRTRVEKGSSTSD